jgi:replicative DNA helicase
MNMEERNFGYLGFSFQQSLIKAIIEDKKYGENIIDVLESKYFENASFKFIMENFKELYKNYNRIPDYSTLSQKIMAEGSNKEIARKHLDTLEAIKADEQNTDYVKDTALNFCKQQNLKKELKNVNNIIENGDFESYHKIEEIIQKAMQVGICNDEAVSVFHDMDGALEADYRTPIATGIVGIDNLKSLSCIYDCVKTRAITEHN